MRLQAIRLLSGFMVLSLIFLSACGQKAEEQASSQTAEDQLVEDEIENVEGLDGMSDGMAGRREPRLQNGVQGTRGEPLALEVLDDTANPVIARKLLTREEIATGWISLFDGNSLFGWQSNNPDVNWKVEEGAITADVGPAGLLLTKVPFVNYELLCEFRFESGGNSGLFLRSKTDPKDLLTDCIELNIADKHPEGYTTGSLVSRAKTNTVAPYSADWQTLHVTVNHNQVIVELNGEEVLEYLDEKGIVPESGFIGLQQRFGKIAFRKVNVKPYALRSIFNGVDLNGWHEVPGSKAKFTVEDSCIRVQGGAGFLETDHPYKDFILQMDVRTGIKEINSGFFFRAEKGTEKAPSNGYEVQIHNGFVDNNRDQPNNSGSGAIFRRADARRVVANDLEWYTMTLVADGPQFSVWVDGFQVVDWKDERKADPNPRKGLRLDAGYISLQGHDPTTDCEFRSIRIAEISEQAAP